jgi:hypothetical protein
MQIRGRKLETNTFKINDLTLEYETNHPQQL